MGFDNPRPHQPEVGEILGGRYQRTRFIGKGAQGSVWECRDLVSGERYACKSFPMKLSLMKEFDAEVRALRRLNGHKHVVKLVDVLSSGVEVHVIMELVLGGDLLSEVLQNGPLQEEDASPIFRQLAEAVAYCHASGVMHRDIKPDNVLLQKVEENEEALWEQDSSTSSSSDGSHTSELTDSFTPRSNASSTSSAAVRKPSCPQPTSTGRRGGDTAGSHVASFPKLRTTAPQRPITPERAILSRVKLVDFALSEVVSKDGRANITGHKAEVVGTKQYMAPEVRSGYYDLKADVYSMGVTLFATLTGRLPALDQKSGLPVKIDFSSSHLKGVSKEAIDLLKCMLKPDPKERLSVFEVLEHPWLGQHRGRNGVLSNQLKAAWTWIEAF